MQSEKVKTLFIKARNVVSVTIPMMVFNAMDALAGTEVEGDSSGSGVADFLKGGSEVSGSGATVFNRANQTTKAVGSSLAAWFITIGVTVAAIAGFIAGMKLMGSPRAKDEAKGRIIAIIAGVIFMGGLFEIINLAFNIGQTALS